MRTVSCDPKRLYANGGLYGVSFDEQTRSQPAWAQWIANVYEPYRYTRPMPANILSVNPDTSAKLVSAYQESAGTFTAGASTEMFELSNVILYDRSLYRLEASGELIQVFETNREIDRGWKRDLATDLLANVGQIQTTGSSYVYFGSVGSGNYAHWLIDDLPRAKAVIDNLGRNTPTVVVLERHGAHIDAVRVESLRAVMRGVDVEIAFVEKASPYLFDRLCYISPSSYTPLLKAPDGIGFLSERLRNDRRTGSPRRLFVSRNATWRNLLNADEVAEFFAERWFHFVSTDAGAMSFAKQVELFSDAEIVIGVGGAAMVNTIFCPASTRVMYLVPEGFTDPWYWDLAAVKGHEYSVCFGTPWKPNRPNFSSFVIDAKQLEMISTWL